MVEMIGDVAKLVRRIAGPGRIDIEFEFLEVPPNRATAMSSGCLVDVP